MTFFAGRSTVYRLHWKVQRNIFKNHQARYDSSKSNTTQSQTSRNASPETSSNAAPERPPQRTIPGPAWAWVDPLMRPFRAYAGMQRRSPLMTQFESALVIYYLGDLSSQVVMSNAFLDAQYEPIRGLRAMLIGSITAIPSYKWFLFLGNNFNYKSHIWSLCVKVAVNQSIFTPVFNTYFFSMQTLLAGGSFKDAKERVINTVPISVKNSLKVWPLVTAFSFTFIPWQHRSVFAGVIAIGWQTYLSWLNRTDENRQKLADSEAKEKKQEQEQEQEQQRQQQPPPQVNQKKKKNRKPKERQQLEEN